MHREKVLNHHQFIYQYTLLQEPDFVEVTSRNFGFFATRFLSSLYR